MGKPKLNKYRPRKKNSKRSLARRNRDKSILETTPVSSEVSSSLWNTNVLSLPEICFSIPTSQPVCDDFDGLLENVPFNSQQVPAVSSRMRLVSSLPDEAMDIEVFDTQHQPLPVPHFGIPDAAQAESPKLCVETVNIPKEPPSTRVLCDLMFLINQARKLEHHGFNCNGRFYCKKIVKLGLVSKVHFQCNNKLCSERTVISTEKPSCGINSLAVLGALATGSGFSQEEEKFAAIGVKYMTQPVFSKCEIDAGKIISSCTEEVLKESIEEEKELAEKSGSVDNEGHACIAAIVDGGWCKRSYGHGYNASSGVAVIIGAATQKILFIGVRNKLCLICNAIKNGKMSPKEHVCFKNWTGASTAMEPDIIVEGLNFLEKVHGVHCVKLIGDGDSNVMSAVTERVAYGRKVQKLECANHSVRRYSRALEKLSKDTTRFRGKEGVEGRKILTARIARLAIGARAAIKRHAVPFYTVPSQDCIEKLKQELRNGPNHVFGRHSACGDWCTRKESDPDGNVFSKVEICGLLSAVEKCVNQVVVCDAKTLIFNATNNPAEHFMSQLSKTYGGKRVDHSRAGGINRRSSIAALAFQARGQNWHARAHKGFTGKSPNTPLRNFLLKRNRSRELRLRARQLFKSGPKIQKPYKARKNNIARGGDNNYGDHPAVPDMNVEEMDEQSKHFISKLGVKKRDDLEQATLGQAENNRWREERLKRISSTHFKRVACRKPYTPTQNLVKTVLYARSTTKSFAMQHGIQSEPIARKKYIDVCGHTEEVKTCGLFIDPEHPYLCTSPDALVGENGLLEIKCPFSAVSISTIAEAAVKHSIGLKISKENNSFFLPESHTYFYQIQGQLAITNRSWCDLFVWSPTDYVLIRIPRNKAFWEKLLPLLSTFYLDALLPEIIDPRVIRGMPTRELHTVTKAIKNRECEKKKMFEKNAEKCKVQTLRKAGNK